MFELPIEISETDIIMIAEIYNDIIGKIDPYKFHLSFKGDFKGRTWYREMIPLIRLMKSIKAKPRLYLQAQVVEYRKPVKHARQVPTIKMMATPAGIERYERFCVKRGLTKSKIHKVTQTELEDFSGIQMLAMMERLHISCQDDFFKDPYLIAQLSQSYVKKHPSFIKLEAEGFYQKEFGVSVESLFP